MVVVQDGDNPACTLPLIKSHLKTNTYISFEFDIKDYIFL